MAVLTRDDVIRIMRQARTLNEVLEAEKAVADWLQDHPDDLQIWFEGESLGMRESALKELETEEERRKAS